MNGVRHRTNRVRDQFEQSMDVQPGAEEHYFDRETPPDSNASEGCIGLMRLMCEEGQGEGWGKDTMMRTYRMVCGVDRLWSGPSGQCLFSPVRSVYVPFPLTLPSRASSVSGQRSGQKNDSTRPLQTTPRGLRSSPLPAMEHPVRMPQSPFSCDRIQARETR